MAPKKAKVPVNEQTELTEEELLDWKEQFQALDPENTGRVPSKDLVGMQLGITTIDEAVAKKLDKEKIGVLYDQILIFAFPKCSKPKLTNFFQRSIPDDLLQQFLTTFAAFDGEKLTEERLVEMEETVLGHKLTAEQFQATGKHALCLPEVLRLLFPSVEQPWMDRFTTTQLSPEQFDVVKREYDVIDPEGKCFVTEKQIAEAEEPFTIAGFTIDLAVFATIDKESSGRITLDQVLRYVYPNLTAAAVQACLKLYTPDKIATYREELLSVEQDSDTQWAKIEEQEAKAFGRILLMSEGQEVPEEEDEEGEGDGEDAIDERDNGAKTPDAEEIFEKQQAQVDAEERQEMAMEEDAIRWDAVIAEHAARLAASEQQMMQLRVLQQDKIAAEFREAETRKRIAC